MAEWRYRGPAAAVLLALSLALAGCSAMGTIPPAGPAALPAAVSNPAAGAAMTVPSGVPGLNMQAELFRPPGAGPFPLAILNHGSEQNHVARARMGFPQFPALTGWLLARGYAVLVPLRPGHGMTGGPYREDQGQCGAPDYLGAGRGAAQAISAAIAFMRTRDDIAPGPVLVLGNSAGGWGALALAAGSASEIGAVVNIAGGRGGRNRGRAGENCAPERLVSAAGAFGATARVPTLWLYAENDSYFGPALSREMADAFIGAGGRAEYVLVPPVAGDGHRLAFAPASAWSGPLGRFLDGLGLP